MPNTTERPKHPFTLSGSYQSVFERGDVMPRQCAYKAGKPKLTGTISPQQSDQALSASDCTTTGRQAAWATVSAA